MFDKRCPRASAFDFQPMASMFCFCVFICGCNEWYDQVLKSCEKLVCLLASYRFKVSCYSIILQCSNFASGYIQNMMVAGLVIGMIGMNAEELHLRL
jgi:hypothetical protein